MKRILFTLGLLTFSVLAESKELRIYANTLEAGPGEVIDLGADIFDGENQQHIQPAEFLWTSTNRPNEVCDLYSSSVCSSETDFRVTPSGVQFHVPGSFSSPIVIVARQRGGELTGTVTLNPRVSVSPQVVVTEPPVTNVVVLERPGHWVYFNDIPYWEPFFYTSWHPYYRPYWIRYPHPIITFHAGFSGWHGGWHGPAVSVGNGWHGGGIHVGSGWHGGGVHVGGGWHGGGWHHR